MKTFILLLSLCAFQLNAQFTLYSPKNSDLSSHNISDIVVDHDNTIWIATDSGLVEIRDNHWTTHNTKNSILLSNRIKDLHLDNNGNLFIFSAESILKHNKNGFELIHNNVSGTSFAIDNFGKILINSDYSLLRSNVEGWDTLVHRPKVNAILIDKIVVDKMNNIYYKYANFGELWVINSESLPKQIEKDKNDNRLIEPYDISLDSNQNLWISGDRKLQYYNVNNDKLMTYDKEFSSVFDQLLVRKTCVNKNNIPYSALSTNFFDTPYLIFLSDNKIYHYNLDEYFSQEVFDWAVNAIYIDLNDNVWIHIPDVGLLKFDPSISNVKLLPKINYSIYPNPTTSSLSIELEDVELITSYKITDTKGKQVLTGSLSPSSLVSIDVEQLTNGVYIIELTTNSGEIVIDIFVKE
ncbi:MAG: T9SS type A sorting domain-containing protein [Candidatus Kapaibacterium sp.]